MLARHPILVYTLLRLVLFLAVAFLLGAIGARGLLLLVLAFVVSGFLSLVLLDGPRSRFGATVGNYFSGINRRIDEAARSEDDDVVDLAQEAQQPTSAQASQGSDHEESESQPQAGQQ